MINLSSLLMFNRYQNAAWSNIKVTFADNRCYWWNIGIPMYCIVDYTKMKELSILAEHGTIFNSKIKVKGILCLPDKRKLCCLKSDQCNLIQQRWSNQVEECVCLQMWGCAMPAESDRVWHRFPIKHVRSISLWEQWLNQQNEPELVNYQENEQPKGRSRGPD